MLPKNVFDDLIPGFQPATAAFYFTGSRAWELLVGTMVALLPSTKKLPLLQADRLPRWAVEVLATLALSAILVPVFLNSRNTPWPGFHALAPCLGTAVLILLHEQHRTMVGVFLSTLPMRGLGLISYSLYLWHWPLFEFYRRWRLEPLAAQEYLILILVAVVLAVLSWRFVEQPFRRPGNIVTRNTMFRAAAAWGGAFVCIGIVTFLGSGFPGRFPPDVQNVYAALDGNAALKRLAPDAPPRCYVRNHGPAYDFGHCFRLDPSIPSIVVWGDSFVGNYLYGFRESGLKSGINVIEASHFDCRPVLDDRLVTHACAAFNRSIMAHLDGRVSAVVISARLFNHKDLVPAVLNTVRVVARRGIKVVVIGASLEYREAEPFYVARYVQTRDASWLNARKFLKPGLAAFDKTLKAVFQDKPGIRYLSVLDTVCTNGHCPMMVDGEPAQSDYGHLTMTGSTVFGTALWPQIQAFALSGTNHKGVSLSASAIPRAASAPP